MITEPRYHLADLAVMLGISYEKLRKRVYDRHAGVIVRVKGNGHSTRARMLTTTEAEAVVLPLPGSSEHDLRELEARHLRSSELAKAQYPLFRQRLIETPEERDTALERINTAIVLELGVTLDYLREKGRQPDRLRARNIWILTLFLSGYRSTTISRTTSRDQGTMLSVLSRFGILEDSIQERPLFPETYIWEITERAKGIVARHHLAPGGEVIPVREPPKPKPPKGSASLPEALEHHLGTDGRTVLPWVHAAVGAIVLHNRRVPTVHSLHGLMLLSHDKQIRSATFEALKDSGYGNQIALFEMATKRLGYRWETF